MSTTGELPSGTVTMLFTDIEGSTRLARSLGNRYQIVLADHHRVLREAWRDHAGQEISTEGDSFFVVFRRAQDALAAAVQAQRALAAHRWPEGADLRVRMGMHTGEPQVGQEGYVGLGVHRAARIAAAAHGGQVLLSEATRHVLEPDELEGVDLRDLGPQRLKDFDEPQRLYQLEIEGLQSVFPPLKTLEVQEERELPFVGREAELAEAARDAIASEARRRRRRIAIGAAAALVVAAAVAAAMLSGGSGPKRPRAGQASGTVASTATQTVTQTAKQTTTQNPAAPAAPPVTSGQSATSPAPAVGRRPSTTTNRAATASKSRSRHAVLTVSFQPKTGGAITWSLTCVPPGGTHPYPGIACGELARNPHALLAPPIPCLGRAHARPQASVVGRFRGRRVHVTFRPGCGERFFKPLHVLLTGGA